MTNNTPPPVARGKVFAVAPMMDWTDRHCRFFHRQLTRHALLYTEMITAAAIRHGERQRLLGFDSAEQPVALQLGGSEPQALAEAARIGEDYGYAEINLNVGCPSDRVQEGRFGACLMAEPQLVADCVAAMRRAVRIPVTVKCRIGIDEQDPDVVLPAFVAAVAEAGCRIFIVHARKAWLSGLSPKENREVPPLDYGLVHRLKAANPTLHIILNGGLRSPLADRSHLENLDGLMYGRSAYQAPWMLTEIDPLAGGTPAPVHDRAEAVAAMRPYIARQLSQDQALHRITRHMLGLFHGEPGGRLWRQILSERAHRPEAGLEVLDAALVAVMQQRRPLATAAE
jgi:tRNA-dihydrouridine synthase A